MKNTFKQKFAFLLAITMLLSTLPTTAIAVDDLGTAPAIIEGEQSNSETSGKSQDKPEEEKKGEQLGEDEMKAENPDVEEAPAAPAETAETLQAAPMNLTEAKAAGVVSIDGQTYASLAEAAEYAQADDVVVVDGALTMDAQVTFKVPVTLKLTEKAEITFSNDQNSAVSLIKLIDDSTLIMEKGSSITMDCNGEGTHTHYWTAVESTGALTVEKFAGTITVNDSRGAALYAGGDITFEDEATGTIVMNNSGANRNTLGICSDGDVVFEKGFAGSIDIDFAGGKQGMGIWANQVVVNGDISGEINVQLGTSHMGCGIYTANGVTVSGDISIAEISGSVTGDCYNEIMADSQSGASALYANAGSIYGADENTAIKLSGKLSSTVGRSGAFTVQANGDVYIEIGENASINARSSYGAEWTDLEGSYTGMEDNWGGTAACVAGNGTVSITGATDNLSVTSESAEGTAVDTVGPLLIEGKTESLNKIDTFLMYCALADLDPAYQESAKTASKNLTEEETLLIENYDEIVEDLQAIRVNSVETLKEAINSAEPGATIKLAAGTYSIGELVLMKPISLQGAGAEDTILNGKIRYSMSEETANSFEDKKITIEGIQLVSTEENSANETFGIQWSVKADPMNAGYIDGYDLTIEDCIIKGFTFGTGLDTKATHCTLNVIGTNFVDNGCAIGFKGDNAIGAVESTDFGDGFAVNYFTGDYTFDGYYNTFESYQADMEDGTLDKPDVDASNNTENIVVFNAQQLKNAIASANTGDTIVLAPGTYTLNENIEIHQKKLNIIGSGKAETIIEAYNNQQVQNDSRITLTGGAEVKFADITFTASYGADIVAPILGVSDTSNLELSQCTITDTSKGYSSGYGLISTGAATAGSKVTMKDCTVNSVIGNNAGVTYYVLGQGGVCELDIQNNVFNLGSWFMFNIQASGIVKNNQFNGVDGASGRAINATQLKGLRVEGNIFDDSLYGTRFVIGGDYTIANNTFEALGDDLAIGIYNKPDAKSEISGNRFDLDAESYGIRVTNLWGGIAGDLGNLNISDNTFTGTGVYHFRNDTWTGKVDLSTNNFGEKLVVRAAVETGIVLPKAPSKDGYEFDGWYSEELNDTYNAGDEVTIDKDTTFTAVWDRISSGGAYHPDADDSTSSDRDDDDDNTEEIEEEDVPLTEGDVADFVDVASGAWYAEAVQYVYENGMMSGTSETTFSPDLTTTRGMIVTILYRLENEPTVTGTTAFTDVAADQYYANAVAWAAQNGIVSGIDATTFAPNNAITREQMAAILYRYAQFKGYDVSAKADLSVYTDAATVGAYATDAMAWANGAQLITGTSATTLTPAGNATRAQVATILMRFCENIAK